MDAAASALERRVLVAARAVAVLAVLYTLVPLLVNTSGAGVWIVPPPPVSVVVWVLAATAFARLGEAEFARGRSLRSGLFAAAAVGWTLLLLLLLAYRPSG